MDGRENPYDEIEPEFPIPENDDGPVTFGPDVNKTALAGGGFKRGEALQLSEEEDDFEDGRSSGGVTSRSEADQWARGDVGSRSVDDRSGYLSVEGSEEGETAAPPVPKAAPKSPGENPPPPPGYF